MFNITVYYIRLTKRQQISSELRFLWVLLNIVRLQRPQYPPSAYYPRPNARACAHTHTHTHTHTIKDQQFISLMNISEHIPIMYWVVSAYFN